MERFNLPVGPISWSFFSVFCFPYAIYPGFPPPGLPRAHLTAGQESFFFVERDLPVALGQARRVPEP